MKGEGNVKFLTAKQKIIQTQTRRITIPETWNSYVLGNPAGWESIQMREID